MHTMIFRQSALKQMRLKAGRMYVDARPGRILVEMSQEPDNLRAIVSLRERDVEASDWTAGHLLVSNGQFLVYEFQAATHLAPVAPFR